MPKLSEPWQEKIETERYTLYLGDCLDILPTLQAGSVDAVVTDPPYGVGFRYASHKDDEENYGEFIWQAAKSAESTLRPGSPIFIWQAAKHIRKLHEWFPRPWRLFVAASNFAQVLPGPMWPAFAPVVVWWTPGGEQYSEGCRRDFFVADSSPSGRENRGEVVVGHPCPRPIQHLLHVVDNWVWPKGICLDPFMGSGTTGVACMKLGRKFIGVEIDPTYFAIAAKRISEARLETPAERALAALPKDGTSADLKKFIAKRRGR